MIGGRVRGSPRQTILFIQNNRFDASRCPAGRASLSRIALTHNLFAPHEISYRRRMDLSPPGVGLGSGPIRCLLGNQQASITVESKMLREKKAVRCLEGLTETS